MFESSARKKLVRLEDVYAEPTDTEGEVNFKI